MKSRLSRDFSHTSTEDIIVVKSALTKLRYFLYSKWRFHTGTIMKSALSQHSSHILNAVTLMSCMVLVPYASLDRKSALFVGQFLELRSTADL